jgi:hypothetical protein
MNQDIVAAVFPDRASAERAIQNLRNMGVPDQSISVIAQHDEGHVETHGDVHEHSADNKASGTMKGLTVGAGVGALFGLAAAFIPGIGPFITAGALAQALGTVGGAAAAGAIVGGTAGTIVGMLENYGLSGDDAKHYAGEIERGGVFVGVATGVGVDSSRIRETLVSAGGQSSAYMA